ncbi:hypothetical protein MJO28_010702 [Puccinia striiformis f. sp. tritici]|uniref:Uncharacterized protein n=2 Tax=Puccinia striiformis TaxID=27350 RepID=A0A2S4URW3_9BASI|nr:hypothetical protein MJO28_010702 [Puccinia striiformis f. sp. tritici]POW00064.1 hypothetical protein PSHT_13250 [Puccinia striiformis]
MQLLMIVATLIASLCFLKGFDTAPIHHKHLQSRSPQAQYNRNGPQTRPQARPYTANARLKTICSPFRPKPRPQPGPSRNAHGTGKFAPVKLGSQPDVSHPLHYWDFGGQANAYTSNCLHFKFQLGLHQIIKGIHHPSFIESITTLMINYLIDYALLPPPNFLILCSQSDTKKL